MIIDEAGAMRWADLFEDAVTAEASTLAQLDATLGDGDIAENLAHAFLLSRQFLAECPGQGFHGVFLALARGFLETSAMSGAIMGTFLYGLARSSRGAPIARIGLLAASIHAGVRTVTHRSGARVGDKTMIDALTPGATALLEAASAGQTPAASLSSAAVAARAGATATTWMPAARGRASTLGHDARGIIDPGAVVVALFFEAGARSTGVGAE